MTPSELQTTVRRAGDAAVIDMRGEIDGGADAAMDAAYATAQHEQTATIVLNFEAVDYINSTGIAVIVGLLSRARRDGRAVTACGLVDHYREIFEITRLADFMPIFDNEAGAVGGCDREDGVNGNHDTGRQA